MMANHAHLSIIPRAEASRHICYLWYCRAVLQLFLNTCQDAAWQTGDDMLTHPWWAKGILTLGRMARATYGSYYYPDHPPQSFWSPVRCTTKQFGTGNLPPTACIFIKVEKWISPPGCAVKWHAQHMSCEWASPPAECQVPQTSKGHSNIETNQYCGLGKNNHQQSSSSQ